MTVCPSKAPMDNEGSATAGGLRERQLLGAGGWRLGHEITKARRKMARALSVVLVLRSETLLRTVVSLQFPVLPRRPSCASCSSWFEGTGWAVGQALVMPGSALAFGWYFGYPVQADSRPGHLAPVSLPKPHPVASRSCRASISVSSGPNRQLRRKGYAVNQTQRRAGRRVAPAERAAMGDAEGKRDGSTWIFPSSEGTASAHQRRVHVISYATGARGQQRQKFSQQSSSEIRCATTSKVSPTPFSDQCFSVPLTRLEIYLTVLSMMPEPPSEMSKGAEAGGGSL